MAHLSLVDGVKAAATCWPHREAVCYNDGSGQGEQLVLNYGQLMQLADELSEKLRSCINYGQVVAITVLNHATLPAWLIGIMSVPAAFLPLDLDLPAARLEYILHKAPVSAILTDQAGLRSLQKKITKKIKTYTSLNICSGKQFLKSVNDHDLVLIETTFVDTAIPSPSLAYVITTSGTTGFPKIVRVPHSCILPNIKDLSSIYELTEVDLVYQASPLTFDPSIVEIFTTLHSGATLLILPDILKKMPRKLATILYELNVTIIQATPSLVSGIGTETLRNAILGDSSKLRILALGGERCPAPCVLKEWRGHRNTTKLINLYGITEVSCWAMYHIISEHDMERNGIPLGVPLSLTQIEYKPTSSETHDDGCLDLYIGGESRQCFIDDETGSNKHKMRASGDIVHKGDNNHVYYLSRQDDQIKRNGKRLNLLELENVTERCSNVLRSVAVYADSVLSLFVQPLTPLTGTFDDNTGAVKSANTKMAESVDQCEIKVEIKKMVTEMLPSHYHPDSIHIVSYMPLTKHGKVNKTALLHNYRAGKRGAQLPKSGAEVKAKFFHLWKKYLPGSLFDGVLVSRHSSGDAMFLESGGDSLSAVRFCEAVSSQITGSDHVADLLELVLYKPANSVLDELLKLLNIPSQESRHSDRSDHKFIDVNQRTSNESADRNDVTSLNLVPMDPDIYQSTDNVNLNKKLKRKNSDDGNFLYGSSCKHKMKNDCSDTQEISESSCSDHTGRRDRQWDVLSISRTSKYYKHLNTGHLISVDPEELIKRPSDVHKNEYAEVSIHEECSIIRSPNIEFRLLWAYNTLKCVDSSPLLVKSRSGRSLMYIGSHSFSCTLCCLDVSTGELVWKQAFHTRIESSPCLSECARYVMAGTYNGELVVCEALAGEVHWKFQAGADIKSSPCVNPTNGSVYVGSHDHNVYCLDIKDKTKIWQCSVEGSVFASPCLDMKPYHLYIATLRGQILTLHPDTGARIWSISVTKPVFSSPVLIPGGVCVACVGGYIHAFSHMGVKLWSYNSESPVFSSVCVYRKSQMADRRRSEQNISDSYTPTYISVTENVSYAKTHPEKSTLESATSFINTNSDSSICIHGNQDGFLTALSSDGRLLWKQKMDSKVYSSPFVFVDHSSSDMPLAVAVCSSGHLCVYDVYSGNLVGHCHVGKGEVYSSPVVWDGKIIVGCRDNNVYCLQMEQISKI